MRYTPESRVSPADGGADGSEDAPDRQQADDGGLARAPGFVGVLDGFGVGEGDDVLLQPAASVLADALDGDAADCALIRTTSQSDLLEGFDSNHGATGQFHGNGSRRRFLGCWQC